MRDSIFQEITAERARQDRLHGGQAHDDRHTLCDWVVILLKHLGMAVDDSKPGAGAVNSHSLCQNPARYRLQLVRVAAVAVAALEAFDCKTMNAELDVPAIIEAERQAEDAPRVVRMGDIHVVHDLLESDMAWWQVHTDRTGEVHLVVSKRNPRSHAEGVRGTYAVPESTADAWEKANYDVRLEPRKEKEPC